MGNACATKPNQVGDVFIEKDPKTGKLSTTTSSQPVTKEDEDKKKLEKAALVIQSRYRGMKSRKKFCRVLVCYSCGHKYGISQMQIHLQNCPAEISNRKKIIPKILRGTKTTAPKAPLPILSSSQKDINAYNEESFDLFKKSRPKCPTCERQFNIGLFVKHIQSCKDEEGETFDVEKYCSGIIKSSSDDLRMKVSLMCYVCGNGQDPEKIKSHLEECYEKCCVKVKSLPDHVNEKIQLPKKPAMEIPKIDSPSECLNYNVEAKISVRDFIKSLPPCVVCKEEFNISKGLDELCTHQSVCKKKNDPVNAKKETIKNQPKEETKEEVKEEVKEEEKEEEKKEKEVKEEIKKDCEEKKEAEEVKEEEKKE